MRGWADEEKDNPLGRDAAGNTCMTRNLVADPFRPGSTLAELVSRLSSDLSRLEIYVASHTGTMISFRSPPRLWLNHLEDVSWELERQQRLLVLSLWVCFTACIAVESFQQ